MKHQAKEASRRSGIIATATAASCSVHLSPRERASGSHVIGVWSACCGKREKSCWASNTSLLACSPVTDSLTIQIFKVTEGRKRYLLTHSIPLL
jgi:hypothetical protein